MSSTPPPPFGAAQGSIPGAGVYDRRTLRAQRQAAAAQARWQRDQMRRQLRAARRTSIVGPLLMVTLGVVLLLLQTGRLHWPDTLGWLGHWWPAVLIIAGLLMMGEWALDRQQIMKSGTAVAPRRTLGGGAVGILIMLAFIGACVMIAENGSAWARRNVGPNLSHSGFGDWRQVFGARSEFTTDLHAQLADNGTLTIDAPRGDVTVTGSSQDGQVHVNVRQHVYSWEQREIENRRRAEAPQLTGDASHLTLVAPTQEEDDADLTIELPHDASVTVRSGRGDISIEELRGTTELASDHGDVKLTALSGPAHLRTQDDNTTVTAHSLAGGLTLDGRSGDISLTDIDGSVVLHGDFFGTTHLEHVRGSVNFQSSFTNFACAGIPGQLNVDGRSDLDAHQLEGPVNVTTTDRNLSLNGVRGATTVIDRNASVTLTLSGPAQPVHVTNENGSVDLAIAPRQGFSLEARTDNGEIKNDFGLNPQKTDDSSLLTGKIAAGGPPLHLQTTQGDITVRRASSDEVAEWDDAPQRLVLTPFPPAPPAPAAPPRHIAR